MTEPVAWIDLYDLERLSYYDCHIGSQQLKGGIPLYTHPVKEQDTDCQYCKQGCIRCDARKQLTDDEIIEVHVKTPFIDGYLNKNLIDFARAILQRASDK